MSEELFGNRNDEMMEGNRIPIRPDATLHGFDAPGATVPDEVRINGEVFGRKSASKARLSEAVKVLEEVRGYMSDMKGLIDKHHESGEMVDGGDLRYWSSLIEFALSKATIGG